VLISVGL